jgi:hypothetical protein
MLLAANAGRNMRLASLSDSTRNTDMKKPSPHPDTILLDELQRRIDKRQPIRFEGTGYMGTQNEYKYVVELTCSHPVNLRWVISQLQLRK